MSKIELGSVSGETIKKQYHQILDWDSEKSLKNIPELNFKNTGKVFDNFKHYYYNDINGLIELETDPEIIREIKKNLIPQNPWLVKEIRYYYTKEKDVIKKYIDIICDGGTFSFDVEKLPDNINENLILHSEVNFDCDENGEVIAIHFKQLGENNEK